MSTGPDNSGDVREELHQLGKEIGDTLQSAPDGSRRTFLAGLASVIGIKAVSDIVSAQEGQPGAACQWLGDQDAAGYGLYRLGILEFEDGTTLETAGEVTNTHINVENNGTQTLADVDAVNFATDLDVSDDGDGSVTVDSTASTGASTNISNDGSQVVDSTDDINFTNNLTASDDADGTATVETSALNEEQVEDTVNSLLSGGSNVSLSYDDPNDTLTIDSSDADSHTDVSEGGTLVVSDVGDVNFADNLSVADDGDGTVTVDAVDSGDTRTDVSDSVGVVVAETEDVTFTASGDASVSVTADGDGTATVDVSATDTDTRTDISDSGGVVVSDTEDVTFDSTGSASVSVASDGDGTGTVTVDATDTDTHFDVSEDGTSVLTDVATLNVTNALDATNPSGSQADLAVDESAIALSNLSGYPVGTGDLDFDTATQTELDSHSGTSDAHHTRYSDEEAQDAIDALLSAGDKLSYTYDDPNNTLTIDTSALDTNEVQDTVNNLMAASSNLSWAYDDANDTLTISLSGPITGVQIGESATRNAGYFSTLDANTSITDAAGVSHSGELSDNPHDNADHSTDMVEDATTTGNAPYEVQKNGTDGTGVINFKT